MDKLLGDGFRFSKGLGQNFITDTNLLNAIGADSGVTDSETIVEVGAGAGTLTEAIARKAKKVVSIEIDTSLKSHLTEKFASYDNVTLVFADVGPGIPDVEKALTPGWSTASAQARQMGFGAGMGLVNIKRVSDAFDLQTSPSGTTITITFRVA